MKQALVREHRVSCVNQFQGYYIHMCILRGLRARKGRDGGMEGYREEVRRRMGSAQKAEGWQ